MTQAQPFTVTASKAYEFNRTAVFHSQDEESTLPFIEIAGVQVYAYVDEKIGVLRVSIWTDTSELPARADGTTPMAVCVNEALVLNDTSAEGVEVETTRDELFAQHGTV